MNREKVENKNKKAKIVFLGSPGVAAEILEFILKQNVAEVLGLWTSPSKRRGRGMRPSQSPAANMAQRYGIAFRECEKIDEAEIRYLQALQADLGLVIAFGSILPKVFFQLPRLGMINIHFSLLPKFRGASPIQAAILKGEFETGISLQKIRYKMDSGAVLLSKKFSLSGLSSPQALHQATELAKPLLQTFFQNYESLLLQSLPAQDESLASYCYKIKAENGWLAKDDSPVMIDRMIRAYQTWPGVYFYIQDEKYTLHSTEQASAETLSYAEEKKISPATLFMLQKNPKKLFLRLRSHVVEIKTLQKSGRKIVSAQDFLNGSKLHFPILVQLRK